MQKYGIIQDGILITNNEKLEGYKPVIYASIPAFNQLTQCVIQTLPVDLGSYIHVGVRIIDIEQVDEGIDEGINV
jgi:hypothetical protein